MKEDEEPAIVVDKGTEESDFLHNKESAREKMVLASERVKTKSAIVEGGEETTTLTGFQAQRYIQAYCYASYPSKVEPPVLVEDEFVSDEEEEHEEEIKCPVMIKYPSRSKALSSLPESFRMLLKRNVMELITEEEAKKCLGPERFQYVCDTNPLPGSLYLIDSVGYAFLYWFTKGPGAEFIIEKGIRQILKFVAGPIRDQKYHIICWAYVCCDLISATRLLHGLDKVFVPLSPMFLCRNINTVRYEKTWQDMAEDAVHCCCGDSIINGLMYAKLHGVTREKPGEELFDCCDANEFIAGEEELYKVKDVLHYKTLEEALDRVKSGYPVAAGLMCFKGWNTTKRCDKMFIYNGPTSQREYSIYDHSVLNGVKVAICKSSYGEEFGAEGYFAVNLERMITVVGVCKKEDTPKWCKKKPQYLLSSFFSVDVELGSHPLIPVDPDRAKENMKFKVEDDVFDDLLAPIYQHPLTSSVVSMEKPESLGHRNMELIASEHKASTDDSMLMEISRISV